MLRIITQIIICYVVIPAGIILAEEKATTWEPKTLEERPQWMPQKSNEVLIAYNGISMPLGRIILIKNGLEYCAIKFINTWLGKAKHDHYSLYEFYYSDDGTGDFSNSNVLSGTGELFFPEIRPLIFDVGYSKGSNKLIQCGRMTFKWYYPTLIIMDKYELAPTPWNGIKDINTKDPRIQWFKKGSVSKRYSVPIDRFWNDKP